MGHTIGTIYHLLPQGNFVQPFNYEAPFSPSSYALDRLGPYHEVILRNITKQIQAIYGDKADHIQKFKYRQYEMYIVSSDVNSVYVASEINLRRNLL